MINKDVGTNGGRRSQSRHLNSPWNDIRPVLYQLGSFFSQHVNMDAWFAYMGANRVLESVEKERKKNGRGERGMQMRSYRVGVIVGSPGAGQYRVFSSVREHSKHRATMAQNGRQLPDAAPDAQEQRHRSSRALYPSLPDSWMTDHGEGPRINSYYPFKNPSFV